MMNQFPTLCLAAAIATLPASAHAAARAAECSYDILTFAPDVTAESIPPRAHRPGDPWHPFERVRVQAGTKMRIQPTQGSRGEPVDFEPAPRERVAILVPCPPNTSAGGAWTSFWAALNPRPTTTATGATTIYRGGTDAAQAAQTGPLRPLKSLAPAAGVAASTTGLALAWAGGTPPFSVTLDDQATPTRSDQRTIWLPEWHPPASTVIATIKDAAGATLRRRIRILPPPPTPDNDVAAAVDLYVTTPEYRLEALRRLTARAQAGDNLATHARDLILVDATP